MDLKHFYQRGKHGWSHDDLFNFDTYISGVIYEAIDSLRNHEWAGSPMPTKEELEAEAKRKGFDPEALHRDFPEEEKKKAWQAVHDIYRRKLDFIYDKFKQSYDWQAGDPLHENDPELSDLRKKAYPEGVISLKTEDPEILRARDEYHEKSIKREERIMKETKEALDVLKEIFYSLWV